MYKIAIIGGGVIGGMIACAMAKYENSIVILEKENDVAMGQSKANSGIVHAGYDPMPGSLKAKLNVRGSQMMEEVCHRLDVKYRRNGTLIAAFDESDMDKLRILLDRGRKNGVEGLEIINGDAARKMEKNLSENIIGALYAPTGAVVCPYELTIHAIGNAMDNGAELILNFQVRDINKKGELWQVTAADGRTVDAEIIVNCAGIYSDKIAAMVGDASFAVTPRKGEYLLLDKEAGDMLNMTIFRTPTDMGKGVLATKTVDGNILLGPTSVDGDDKEDKDVTGDGIERVIASEFEFFESLPLDKVITQFAGLRAHGDQGDFIINSPTANFINVAGIESPGLTSAPAIGEMVEKMLLDMGVSNKIKENYKAKPTNRVRFSTLSPEEKNRIIADNPEYGRIVCRCEEVTEGEIIEAIRNNPPARDVDGVKRRTRSGMGRCQGGFCMPAVVEILARELGIPFEDVTKSGGKSFITAGKSKKGGNL